MSAVSSTCSRPEPTQYSNFMHETRDFYLKNNPWIAVNDTQKQFRFCIMCGNNRFSDQEWAVPISKYHLVVCDKISCQSDYRVAFCFINVREICIEDAYDRQQVEYRRLCSSIELSKIRLRFESAKTK